MTDERYLCIETLTTQVRFVHHVQAGDNEWCWPTADAPELTLQQYEPRGGEEEGRWWIIYFNKDIMACGDSPMDAFNAIKPHLHADLRCLLLGADSVFAPRYIFTYNTSDGPDVCPALEHQVVVVNGLTFVKASSAAELAELDELAVVFGITLDRYVVLVHYDSSYPSQPWLALLEHKGGDEDDKSIDKQSSTCLATALSQLLNRHTGLCAGLGWLRAQLEPAAAVKGKWSYVFG